MLKKQKFQSINPLLCTERDFRVVPQTPRLKVVENLHKSRGFFVVKENVMIYILSDQTKSRMITDVQVKIF